MKLFFDFDWGLRWCNGRKGIRSQKKLEAQKPVLSDVEGSEIRNKFK